MEWYYSKNQKQEGPVSLETLKSKIGSGLISATDLVWKEGMTEWLPVAQVPEVAEFLPSSATQTSPAAPASYSAPQQAAPVTQQTAVNPMTQGADIPNYLWQSIVVTILCCWPFGIPAIVFAAKVDGLKQQGDLFAAKAASDSAKKWCWVSAASALVVGVLYFGLILLGVVAEQS